MGFQYPNIIKKSYKTGDLDKNLGDTFYKFIKYFNHFGV
jgi:hypothetical protein